MSTGDPVVAAAMVTRNVGDHLAGLDQRSVDAGRIAGRIETLLWAQAELEVELRGLAEDRFADTRGLDAFLSRVRDSLKAVQDGSGEWAGLVRSLLGGSGGGGSADVAPPTA